MFFWPLFTRIYYFISAILDVCKLKLNPSKTEFMLIGNSRQLAKIENLTLSLPDNVYVKPVSSAQNLGVIFDGLSFTDHVSSVSKACYCHIRNLRRIRSSLDQSTATTIATYMIHSKLDYCNSLFLNLPKFELNRMSVQFGYPKPPYFLYPTIGKEYI
jgi:hypothetical protein